MFPMTNATSKQTKAVAVWFYLQQTNDNANLFRKRYVRKLYQDFFGEKVSIMTVKIAQEIFNKHLDLFEEIFNYVALSGVRDVSKIHEKFKGRIRKYFWGQRDWVLGSVNIVLHTIKAMEIEFRIAA